MGQSHMIANLLIMEESIITPSRLPTSSSIQSHCSSNDPSPLLLEVGETRGAGTVPDTEVMEVAVGK